MASELELVLTSVAAVVRRVLVQCDPSAVVVFGESAKAPESLSVELELSRVVVSVWLPEFVCCAADPG